MIRQSVHGADAVLAPGVVLNQAQAQRCKFTLKSAPRGIEVALEGKGAAFSEGEGEVQTNVNVSAFSMF